jgi:phosphatidylserine decarboxylase
MTLRTALATLMRHEDLNFLLTNCIPRRHLTLFMGWFSKLEQPWLRTASIALWRLCSDLDLSDARPGEFRSLHDCFTRSLRRGARTVTQDPALLASPCDAIIGANGPVLQGCVLQAKGFAYPLAQLLGDPALADYYAGGQYVTLRLRATMYHRFHAPGDCTVEQLHYFPGDTWNVNPIALRRVERLFCRNERAVIQCRLAPDGALLTLVPVAAILVASIRLHFLDLLLHLRYRGPHVIPCDARLRRGEEMGWFEHGSTIIVLAPGGISLCPQHAEGATVRMGEPLLRQRR